MPETIELNVEVEVQSDFDLENEKQSQKIWISQKLRGLHFLVCVQANHLSTEDEYFLSVRGVRS